MLTCPKCGSPRIHRSRSRGWLEKLRKGFTHDRPHRCHACGWRGWGPESDRVEGRDRSSRSDRPSPDLAAIDIATRLEEQRRKSGVS